MKTIKPTIEQRLSDAYLQGYDEGSREQAHVFEDITEAVSDYHKFNKYGFNPKERMTYYVWYVLITLILGVVASMIFTNHNYGMINV